MNSEKVYRVGIFKGVGDLSFSGSATITPGSASAAVNSGDGGGSSAPMDPATLAAYNAQLCQSNCDKVAIFGGTLAANTCRAACPSATPSAGAQIGSQISAPDTISQPGLSSMIGRLKLLATPAPKVVKMPGAKTASSYQGSSSSTPTLQPLRTDLLSSFAPSSGSSTGSDNTLYYVLGGIAVLGAVLYLSLAKK